MFSFKFTQYKSKEKKTIEGKQGPLELEIPKIFSLPFLERLLGHDYKAWNWIFDEKSVDLFNKARDGQGFALFFKKIIKDNLPYIQINLVYAYNKNDGLARYDKDSSPINDYVFSPVPVSMSGAGVIHKEGVKKLIEKDIKEEIDKDSKDDFESFGSEISVEDLITKDRIEQYVKQGEGMIFAGGLIKGAESKKSDDYDVIILKPNSDHIKILIKDIQESFQFKRDESFELKKIESLEFKLSKKNKKIIILIESNKNKDEYEVYYLQNKIFVPSPYNKNKEVVSISKKDMSDEEFKDEIVSLSLKSLNLDQRVYIKNKSASQNNDSISYDKEFESYIMYLDPEKYLLNKEGELVPEGIEEGSLFEVQRSIPMLIMNEIAPKIFNSLGMSDQEIKESIKSQKKNWSSWSDKPQLEYDKVIQTFYSFSPEEKIKIIIENIHVTLHLYFETLKEYSYAIVIAEKIRKKADDQKKNYNNKELHKSIPYLKVGFQDYFKLNPDGSLDDKPFLKYIDRLDGNLCILMQSAAGLGLSAIPLDNKDAPLWLNTNLSINEILNNLLAEQNKLENMLNKKNVATTLKKLKYLLKNTYGLLTYIESCFIPKKILNLTTPDKVSNDVFIGLLKDIEYVYPKNKREAVLKKLLKNKEAVIIKNALESGLFDLANIVMGICQYSLSQDHFNAAYKNFLRKRDIINVKKLEKIYPLLFRKYILEEKARIFFIKIDKSSPENLPEVIIQGIKERCSITLSNRMSLINLIDNDLKPEAQGDDKVKVFKELFSSRNYDGLKKYISDRENNSHGVFGYTKIEKINAAKKIIDLIELGSCEPITDSELGALNQGNLRVCCRLYFSLIENMYNDYYKKGKHDLPRIQ